MMISLRCSENSRISLIARPVKKRSGTVKAYSSHIDLEKVEEIDIQNNPNNLPLTWKKLSNRLDTICFVSSLSFVIVVGVAFFVIVAVKP